MAGPFIPTATESNAPFDIGKLVRLLETEAGRGAIGGQS
jgi:hypothetical protein